MAVFEVEGQDGKTYEVEASDMQSAAEATRRFVVQRGSNANQARPGASQPTPGQAPASFEQIMRALRNADAAGDTQAAKRLAQMAAKAKQTATPGQNEVPPGMFLNPTTGQMTSRDLLKQNVPVSRTDAAIAGGMQGTGLNLGDEVAGGIGYLMGGPDEAKFRREQARAAIEANQEAHPWAYGGSNVGGAVATSAATLGGLGAGPTLFNTMVRGAGVGALEGGIWGFGDGEGASERAKSGGQGIVAGGLLGGAAPMAVKGVTAAGGAVRDAVSGGVDSVINRGSKSRAQRVIMDALKRSGKNAKDINSEVLSARVDGQPDFRLMDALGIAGQRKASGLVRSGGDGAEEIARYLEQRQLDQPDRVASFVEDGFGFRGAPRNPGTDVVPQGHQFADGPADVLRQPQTTAARLTGLLTDARSAQANTAYEAARQGAGPVDVRGAVDVIDARIGGMQGSNIAGDSIDGRLARFRDRLIADPAPGDEVSRELSDFDRVLGVKQDVQDAIGAAQRAGRNNEARELTKLAREIDRALEASSDGYRAANDQFRSASQMIGAVGDGAAMTRRGARAQDTTAQFRAMTPEQQQAARIGYGDRLLANIEASAAPTANRAKPMMSTKAQEEIGAMSVDPALLNRRLGRENTMWETQNRALGGSRTADNLEDIKGTGPITNVGRAIKSAANLQLGEAAQHVGAAVGPALTGNNDATRQLIARMLMSDNPQQTLAPVLRQNQVSEKTRRLLETLLRQELRDPIQGAVIPR